MWTTDTPNDHAGEDQPKPPNSILEDRRTARRLILTILYEVDTTTHNPEDVLEARIAASPVAEEAAAFIRGMVRGIMTHVDPLDAIIGEHAPEWPVEQIAYIDRNILRIAIFELAFNRLLEAKIAINEAVELAKVYGSDSAPRFVNGVLGSVVTQYDTLPEYFEEQP
jgi:N utilization substance protein B